MGAYVLELCCSYLKTWKSNFPDLCIAVNISPTQIPFSLSVSYLSNVLNKYGLKGSDLELEITETSLMLDIESSVLTLNALKDLGVKIALDDFGTGYSSLSYLKKFPIDVLKIDKLFINDITSMNDKDSIISAIIIMASSLNLHIICEGVETQLQLSFLKSKKCDEGQGYFFSKPLSADSFGVLLADQSIQLHDNFIA
jgi:EAL domain-containing protein (putative c-di-GMP-specific phosphodiesterase class I)